MYAFGDIKLKKPIPVKKVAFIFAAFIVWSFPVYIFLNGILDSMMHPLTLGIVFLPPFIFGHYASKPVFGGKTMKDFFKTQYNYMKQPKGWSDFKIDNDQQNSVYYISSEISISRRREIQYLKQIVRKRAETQGLVKKKNKDYKKNARQRVSN